MKRKYIRDIAIYEQNMATNILGDPGAVSGDGEKSKTGEKKFGRIPLTAPGSPRMGHEQSEGKHVKGWSIVSKAFISLFYQFQAFSAYLNGSEMYVIR